MAVVEQKVDAVLFRLNRIVVAFAVNGKILDRELVTAWSPCVGTHGAGYEDRRLLVQVLETRPHFGRYLFLHEHALHDTAAITQHDEGDLAVCARGLDPTANRYGSINVFAEMFDFAGH